jgi:stage II sporulation protein M
MKKKIKKQESFNGVYSECFKFIKSSKNYLLFTIAVFILFAVFGYFAKLPGEFESRLLAMLKEIAERFVGLNLFETIWKIFSNNLLVSLMALILGVFFGIFPILATISNGILVGFVARKAVDAEGILILWRLMPHGIFELPAVFISISLGIKLGFELMKKDSLKENFRNSIYVFVFIVVPLLAIAALIEGLLVFYVR